MLQLKIFLAQTTEHMRDLEIVMPIIFCRFTDLCIPPPSSSCTHRAKQECNHMHSNQICKRIRTTVDINWLLVDG